MKPSFFGWVAILFGIFVAVVVGGLLLGGNLFVMGIGLFFVLMGGVTKAKGSTKRCPHCKSEIDATATACPRCTRDV